MDPRVHGLNLGAAKFFYTLEGMPQVLIKISYE
jgi:hypothetical protein